VLFTDPAFLFLFLPLVLGLYLALRGHDARNVWLVVASLAFYSTGGGKFVTPMLAMIAGNYALAVAIDRAHVRSPRAARRLLAATVGANLMVLGWYKYADFLAGNANAVAQWWGGTGWPLPGVALPIGISFFTFHAISYVVDVKRGHATAQKNPVHAALYLLLFPQLIAGPIIRYREIADQLAARLVTWNGFAYGVRRFLIGLGKKVLVADIVAGPCDRIFALPADQVSTPLAWLGIACYTLQIYFDFSGYSDMAIGLAAMMGFRFPENFDHPYVSRSIQEFWRRWHMSLSRWFRDYLYIPIGGSRVSSGRVYVNLVTVFFLCGLWHGARWTFVAWGLYHGAFLVVERLGFARVLARAPRIVGHAYALLAVMVGWVLFRSESLPEAGYFLRAMAGLQGAVRSPFSVWFFLDARVAVGFVAGVIGAGPWMGALGRRVLAWRPARPGPRLVLDAAVTAAFALVFLAATLFIASGSYSPFIYFRF
jgi:alginate O-acetyltransferase complex protein AlgI